MKLLSDILYRTRLIHVVGSTNTAIEFITMDSRTVRNYGLFIAIKGLTSDGHQFIETAIQHGAVAVVCESMPENLTDGVTYVQVKNSAEALGFIASNFYNNPSEKIKLVAITGTNGKTTTASLLFSLTKALGYGSGLLSTIVNRINNKEIDATHTTPDAIQLNKLLAQMVDEGCEYCFMEASSHALHQHRLDGLKFSGAVFTNITHDHLDYHGTFNEYILAKKILFDSLPSSAFAIVNRDDRHSDVMVQNCHARIRKYALQSLADYKAKIVENGFSGLHLSIDNQDLYIKLIGTFNAYNVLAVYATACELGLNKLEVLTQISMLDAPSGRFQYFKTVEQITAVVDYAHTPDALKNVLETIKELRTGIEQLITIVGCGGDRDRSKRPVMANIAASMSDRVVLTSDNPRSENPDEILAEMKAGLDPVQMKKTLSISDRREAIKVACTLAKPGDIILIAGKGHEKYQEIQGVKYSFDDLEVVTETFKTMQK